MTWPFPSANKVDKNPYVIHYGTVVVVQYKLRVLVHLPVRVYGRTVVELLLTTYVEQVYAAKRRVLYTIHQKHEDKL